MIDRVGKDTATVTYILVTFTISYVSLKSVCDAPFLCCMISFLKCAFPFCDLVVSVPLSKEERQKLAHNVGSILTK